MKITHVAEIVNIGHVARILEAEICGAENLRAIPLYNPKSLEVRKAGDQSKTILHPVLDFLSIKYWLKLVYSISRNSM